MTPVRSLEEYLDLPYAIAVSRGEGPAGAPWTAVVEELGGCEASGPTPEEAVARAREAMAGWIGTALAEGRPVPEPRPAPSGKLLVRMPRSLHAELARAANREGISLNQFISAALGAAVAWRQEPGAAVRADLEAPVVNGRAPEADTRPAATPGLEPARPAATRSLQPLLVANLVLVAVAVVVAILLLATAS